MISFVTPSVHNLSMFRDYIFIADFLQCYCSIVSIAVLMLSGRALCKMLD